ncbi:dodecin family protein [Paraliomyxa miuraensis]|uniref:dodecin family protein n=1 Tax=Paraliomyxa miuraensis TaxID=376150 RepID=UPI002257ABB2|nr:dodecin family protein [Paraliomyxa miuraensis]MCX4240306.1 dodecin family protein [Paraliomyxa miuraensis]
MSVARITEVTAQSSESFEHAIAHGIERAAKTLHNIQAAWIKDQELLIENGHAKLYRVTMKITFVLDESR